MNLAYLKNGVVIRIAPSEWDPGTLDFDTSRDATGASIGATWNGSAFIPKPRPVTELNRITVEADLATDLANMQTIISGPATMTTAQLTSAVKALARCNRRLIRIGLARFDGAD